MIFLWKVSYSTRGGACVWNEFWVIERHQIWWHGGWWNITLHCRGHEEVCCQRETSIWLNTFNMKQDEAQFSTNDSHRSVKWAWWKECAAKSLSPRMTESTNHTHTRMVQKQTCVCVCVCLRVCEHIYRMYQKSVYTSHFLPYRFRYYSDHQHWRA